MLMTLALLVPVENATAAPTIGGMVSASAFGGFVGVAAPGSYVEVYGSNLAGTSRGWAISDFSGITAPTSLDGVTVSVNGAAAYINYVSPGQVNIQIPDSVPLGGTVAVVVSYQGLPGIAASLLINAVEPGLLAPASLNVNGTQYVAAFHGNSGVAVSTTAPAVEGETLIFYGIGFGAVKQAPVAGQLARGSTALVSSFTMTIGGSPATIQYAGLAPGLVGVYQFNVVVPTGLVPRPTAFPATPHIADTGISVVVRADLPVQIALNGTAISLQTLVLPVTGSPAGGTFTLTSSAGVAGGLLPADYTCDGTGSTLPLSWSNAPAGTKEFVVLMTTLPGDGTTKWNWVLYHIPATAGSLSKDSFLVGTTGVGSDGPGTVYNPPCSQGPGAKTYTWTAYALSDVPAFSVAASQVTGQMVADAIASLRLASASLNLNFTRTTLTGSSTGCGYIGSSLRASRSGTATVSCDGTWGYISSTGITSARTMNGITSTNLQIPVPQNFQGAYGWKIPLSPVIAAVPTSVVDGPLGVAINGVPIFNPCTQGGCTTGGDTKVLGQLDTCNGHAGRADDYHYHAAPNCMMADQPSSYWDTHPLGWALDGFAIFGYNDAGGTIATRDNICGGNTQTVPNAPAGYSYHVTDTSPYITSCLAGTPSPDLANQGSKYKPFRQPPVTPFNVSGMTLTTDAADGYQVLQFTSPVSFKSTETGSDSYSSAAGTYKIRYKQVTGADLAALLVLRQNANASACWNFQFTNSSGLSSQPAVSYCK